MTLSNYWYKLQNEEESITNETTYEVVFSDNTTATYPLLKGYVGGLYLTQKDYPCYEYIHCTIFLGNNHKALHVQFFVGGITK